MYTHDKIKERKTNLMIGKKAEFHTSSLQGTVPLTMDKILNWTVLVDPGSTQKWCNIQN
jgi:hypothetical protein